jgi:RecA/RadA recombinase
MAKKTTKSIREIAQVLNKKFGRGTIMTADRAGHVIIPRWSTGIFLLDLRLGGGILENGVFVSGLPAGRWAMSFGQKQTGKTTNFMRAVGVAQRTCANCFRVHPFHKLVPGLVESIDPNTGEVEEKEALLLGDCECGNVRNTVVVWIDQENKWDGVWAACNQIQKERLILCRPCYAEEGADVVEALIESGEIDILVYDSIAAATPSKEIEEETEKHQQGIGARIFNKAVRKWNAALIKRSRACEEGEFRIPTIWLINQIRYKIGVLYGSNETTPGGQGIGFANSVEMRTSGGGSKKDYTIGENGETYAVELGVRITKNQSAPSGGELKYKIAMDHPEYEKGQVIDFKSVFDMGVATGVIEQISAKKFLYNGQEFVNMSSITKMWAANQPIYEETKSVILRSILADDSYA